MNPVRVESVKPICNIQFLSVNKSRTPMLPIVRTNLLFVLLCRSLTNFKECE